MSTKRHIIYIDNHSTSSIEDVEIALRNVEQSAECVFLLNIHLNWEGRALDENYGFSVANLLRTKYKSKAAIIFYSPIRKEFFELKSKTETKYKLLFAPGSYFQQLTFYDVYPFKKAINKTTSISEITLHDISTMLCDLKGIVIDKLNHDLKPVINSVRPVIESVSIFLNPAQRRLLRLDYYTDQLLRAEELRDFGSFKSIKSEFIQLCTIHLTSESNSGSEVVNTEFTILFLDDDEEVLNEVQAKLGNGFKVLTSKNSSDAIQILENDTAGLIVAVVCDWRLFKDTNKTYWQELQGYEVLQKASVLATRSLFALTSQADFVVHQIRNQMEVRFQLIKKESIRTNEQWQTFADVLHEACLSANESRASLLDDNAKWNYDWKRKGVEQPTLKQQYVYLFNNIDRQQQLDEISSKADELWEYVKDISVNDPHVTGKFESYGISLKTYELPVTLILRRIWYALYFLHKPGAKSKNEAWVEHRMQVYQRIFGMGKSESVASRINRLCIKVEQMRSTKFLFPEEVSWLKSKSILP